MSNKFTVQELQDIHFTSVEKFFNAWATKKINQNFLKELPNTNGDVAKVILSCLEDGRNPFIANGSNIRDQSRKWNEAEKIVKHWKDLYQFDVIQFILNYEQEHDHKGFYQVNDPILTLNAYFSIIGSYIVKDYLDELTNPT